MANHQQYVKIALVAVAVYLIWRMITVSKRSEGYFSARPEEEWPEPNAARIKGTTTLRPMRTAEMPRIISPADEEARAQINGDMMALAATSADLLPKPASDVRTNTSADWAQYAPKAYGMSSSNFLDNSSTIIGADTIGSSMKNANLSIRKDPVIPLGAAANIPWGLSTITPDPYRRPLGDC